MAKKKLKFDIVAEDKYSRQMQKAENSVTKFAASAKKSVFAIAGVATAVSGAVAVAGAAVVKVTKEMSEQAREMENLSRLAKANVEDFQAAAFATKQYGVSAEKLADISKDVQDKLGDFIATGGGGFKDFFEQVAPQVGLTTKALQKLSGPDALIAVQKAMDDANISAAEQVFHLESLASDSALLAPLLKNNGELFKSQAEEARDLGLVLSAVDSQKLLQVAAATDRLDGVFEGLKKRLSVEFAPVLTGLTDEFTDLIKRAGGFGPVVEASMAVAASAIGVVADMVFNLKLIWAGLDSVILRGASKIADLALSAGEFMADLLGKEVEVAEGVKRNALEMQVAAWEAQRAFEAMKVELPPSEKIKAWLAEVQAASDAAARAALGEGNTIEIKPDISEFDREMGLLLDKLKNQGDKWADGFTNSIIDATKSGKDAFKDFANSVLKDIARIALKQMIVAPLLRTMGLNVAGPEVSGAKAMGGPVNSGKTYLVGEKGPELFTPKTSGQIIPNNKISSSGSAVGGNVTVNVVNNAGADVEVKQRNQGGQQFIDIMLSQVARNIAGGGVVRQAMDSSKMMAAR